MTQHILLDKAKRSEHQVHPEIPEGAAYDTKAGWWYNENSADGSSFPIPGTKKNDIETGEDMKGE